MNAAEDTRSSERETAKDVVESHRKIWSSQVLTPPSAPLKSRHRIVLRNGDFPGLRRNGRSASSGTPVVGHVIQVSERSDNEDKDMSV